MKVTKQENSGELHIFNIKKKKVNTSWKQVLKLNLFEGKKITL